MGKNQQWLAAAVCAVVFLISNGCVLTSRPQHTVNNFDLSAPAQIHLQDQFTIAPFRNFSPSRTRMFYRQSSNRIVQDEYNCWIQSPEAMLQRMFTLTFPLNARKNAENLSELRVDILAFEFDLKTQEAYLALNYTLKKPDSRQTGAISIREKAATPTAPAFAEAMNQAAAKATQQIWKIIQTAK